MCAMYDGECLVEKRTWKSKGTKAVLRKPCLIFKQTCFKERDEKIEELQAALQEAKQKLDAKQRDSEQGLRRSKRVAASCALQQELTDTKAKLEQCQMELNTTSSGKAGSCSSKSKVPLFKLEAWALLSLSVAAGLKDSPDFKKNLWMSSCSLICLFLELRKYQRLLEPPPSAKPITVDVDKKLEDGQKVTLSLLEKETLAHQSACQ